MVNSPSLCTLAAGQGPVLPHCAAGPGRQGRQPALLALNLQHHTRLLLTEAAECGDGGRGWAICASSLALQPASPPSPPPPPPWGAELHGLLVHSPTRPAGARSKQAGRRVDR